MAEVVLDGEPVSFEGPPPSSSSEVWALIEGHLGQSGLLIDQFLVDGALWTPDLNDNQENYELIEVCSMTLEQNVAKIVETLLREGTPLMDRWKSGAVFSLSKPWSHFQSEGLEILNETQPLVQSLGLLTEYSEQKQLSWSETSGKLGAEFNAALSSLMDAFEAGDCIAYSDIAAAKVGPALGGVYELLSDQVLPSLATRKRR